MKELQWFWGALQGVGKYIIPVAPFIAPLRTQRVAFIWLINGQMRWLVGLPWWLVGLPCCNPQPWVWDCKKSVSKAHRLFIVGISLMEGWLIQDCICEGYVRVVLNSFIWKTSSSPKKIFRRAFANSMFFFRGTCWRRFLRKTWMSDILKLFQASDASSHIILRQLHLNIYFKMLVLAHLHRSVLTQQVHSLGHLAFKWRSSFAKALAKLSRKIPQ